MNATATTTTTTTTEAAPAVAAPAASPRGWGRRTASLLKGGKGEVLTSGDVARACRVSGRCAIKWADSGLLPCHRLPNAGAKGVQGDHRRFLRADVVAFMRGAGIPVPDWLLPPEGEAAGVGGAAPPPPPPPKKRGSRRYGGRYASRFRKPPAEMTVFTTGEVSLLLSAAPRTVSKWIDAGELPGYRLPGSEDRRVTREALLAFMLARGVPLPDGFEPPPPPLLLVASAGPPPWLWQAAEALPEGWARAELCPTLAALGALWHKLRPAACVIDLSLGRQECLGAAALMRGRDPEPVLLALPCEDEVDVPALERVFDRVISPGCDLAAVLKEECAP